MDEDTTSSSRLRESFGWEQLDKRKYYFFGPITFLGVRILNHPAMLIKTRLQVQQGRSSYTGTWNAIGKIVRSEGIRGMYQGFGVNSLNLVSGQLYITVFEYFRSERVLGKHMPETFRNLVAAGAAVAVSQVIGNPLDVLSQKVMVMKRQRSAPSPRGYFFSGDVSSTARALWASGGLRSFYRGYLATIAQNAPSSGIWWSMYAFLRGKGMEKIPHGTKYERVMQRSVEIVSGSGAGASVAVLASPLDIIRTRVQVDQCSVSTTVKRLFQQEGLRGFYKGATARMLLLVPNGAIIMFSYELVKRLSLKEEIIQEIREGR